MKRNSKSFDNLEDIIKYLETVQPGNKSASCNQNNIWIAKDYSIADLYNDLKCINVAMM